MANARPRSEAFEIPVMGDGGVGKQSVMERFCMGYATFWFDPHGTGEECSAINDAGRAYLLNWHRLSVDWIRESGQYSCPYWRSDVQRANGLLLIYCVTSKRSFDYVKSMYQQILEESRSASIPPCPIFLIANKIDCEAEFWEIGLPEGERFGHENGLPFFAVSCKTGAGFRGVQQQIVSRISATREGKWAIGPKIRVRGHSLSDMKDVKRRLAACLRSKSRPTLETDCVEKFPSTPEPAGPKQKASQPLIRIAMVGANNVGRTSLRNILSAGIPLSSPEERDHGFKGSQFNEDDEILWDTSHFTPRMEKRENGIVQMQQLAKQNEGILLIYDVGDRRTFEEIKWLYNECHLQKHRPGMNSHWHFWVIANKIDLDPDTWQVSLPEGAAFSCSIGATFLAASCQTKEGLGGVKEQIIRRILTMRDGKWAPVPELAPREWLSMDEADFKNLVYNRSQDSEPQQRTSATVGNRLFIS